MKIKLTTRVWILILCLFLAVVAINPLGYLEKGVLVKNVRENSTAYEAGFRSGEIIKEVNGQAIETIDDYSKIMSAVVVEPVEFSVLTDNGSFIYRGLTLDFDVDENATITSVYGNAFVAGLTGNITVLEINGNKIANREDFNNAKEKIEPKINLVIKTDRNKEGYILSLSSPLDVRVDDIPSSNLRTGLDLRGGARGLVKPEQTLTPTEMSDLLLVSRERFNVYGIADVTVRSASDLSGNTYMLVEVAGATPEDLEELIGKQGKFEAKIANTTVFIGGKHDITSVCRNDATCARIEDCFEVQGGYSCRFSFSVYLSEEAAQKQAAATANLAANVTEEGEEWLNESLDLYLDDHLVDSLRIAAELRGRAITQVSISGPGSGTTQAEAYKAAQENMLKLQTILITGSLPFKLEIVKLDSISPLLGKEFIKNIFIASLAAIVAVALIIFLRYKKITLTLPIMLTVVSEVTLVLGIAALIKWNLDLASIAGIIAAIGTGVDDQIVIIDESRLGREYSWKERIKRAFFIIIGSFATLCVAMLPLWWAGAGLLKGFALTTIIGISVGVLITRPAFADIVSKVTRE